MFLLLVMSPWADCHGSSPVLILYYPIPKIQWLWGQCVIWAGPPLWLVLHVTSNIHMSSAGEKSLRLVELSPWVKVNLSAWKPPALCSLEALEGCSICVLDPTGLHEVDGCGGGLVFVSMRTRFNWHCAFLFNMPYPKGFIEMQYLVCSEWTVPSARFLSRASKWLWIMCDGCTHLSCLVCPRGGDYLQFSLPHFLSILFQKTWNTQ